MQYSKCSGEETCNEPSLNVRVQWRGWQIKNGDNEWGTQPPRRTLLGAQSCAARFKWPLHWHPSTRASTPPEVRELVCQEVKEHQLVTLMLEFEPQSFQEGPSLLCLGSKSCSAGQDGSSLVLEA